MSIAASAVAKLEAGYNCAQAVLWAFRQESGLSEEVALKLSTAIHGEARGKPQVCGAVAAAALVLALRHRAASEQIARLTLEMMARCAAERKSCDCGEPLIDPLAEHAQQVSPPCNGCRACVQAVSQTLEQMSKD